MIFAITLSATAPVQAASPSSTPQSITIWTGSDQVLVSWQVPDSDGGDPKCERNDHGFVETKSRVVPLGQLLNQLV